MMHRRVYGEEGLAGRDAAPWLDARTLTVEYAGEPLSRCDVEYTPGGSKLREIKRPRPFESSHVLPQLRLFELDDGWWLKAIKPGEYAPHKP